MEQTFPLAAERSRASVPSGGPVIHPSLIYSRKLRRRERKSSRCARAVPRRYLGQQLSRPPHEKPFRRIFAAPPSDEASHGGAKSGPCGTPRLARGKWPQIAPHHPTSRGTRSALLMNRPLEGRRATERRALWRTVSKALSRSRRFSRPAIESELCVSPSGIRGV